MATHIAKVDLASNATDFLRQAIEPGRPVLDRSCLPARSVSKWLGRFAAEPEWQGEILCFHLKTENGGRLTDVEAEPVTARDRRRRLKREFRELEKRLNSIDPQTGAERALKKILTDQFTKLTADADNPEVGSHFLKYQDPDGVWRVVWCWGFQRREVTPIPTAVCPACNALFLKRRASGGKCPSCHEALPIKRFPWLKVIAACLLIGLLGGGAGGAHWYIQPRGVFTGRVVRAADGKGLPDVTVTSTIEGRSVVSEADGTFHFDRLPNGDMAFEVTSEGYQSVSKQYSLSPGEVVEYNFELTGIGEVRGRVVNKSGGLPVPGTTVLIADSPWKAETNAEGEFHFESVPALKTEFTVQREGFPESLNTVVVTADETTNVEFQLLGQARLVGQVVDAVSETPVGLADVELVQTGLQAETDEKGWFAFTHAPTGEVTIRVIAAGFAAAEMKKVLVPEEERTVRIPLAAQATLRGRVILAEANRPAPGVRVTVTGGTLSTTSNDQGQFELNGIRTGKSELTVTAAGFREQKIPVNVVLDKENRIEVILTGEVQLSGRVVEAGSKRPLKGVQILLRELGRQVVTDDRGSFLIDRLPAVNVTAEVTGSGYRVQTVRQQLELDTAASLDVELAGDANLSGQVVDELTGRPVAEAALSVDQATYKAKTDSEGRFRLEAVRSGELDLAVTAAGYTDQKVDVTAAARKETPVTVKVSGNSTLSGIVLNRLTGKAVPKAQVKLTDTNVTVTTDDEGKFSLEKLRAGDTQLNVSAEGYQAIDVAAQATPQDAKPLEISIGGAATLAGVVTDAVTNEPLPGVGIKLEGTPVTATTDKDGAFAIENLFKGETDLVLTAPGFFDQTESIPVKETGVTSAAVSLTGSGALKGEVVDEENQPIPGVTVSVTGTKRKVTTDDKGQFTLDRLGGVKPTLQIAASGFTAQTVTPELKAEETVTLDRVVLSSSLALTGKVINAINGKPASGVTVTIVGTDRSSSTGTLGTFQLEKVSPRAFSIEVKQDGFFTEQIEVAPGRRGPMSIYISPVLKPGEVRFVLTWGYSTPDLDAHLYWNNQNSHVHPGNKKEGNVALDIDDQDGEGPETITINRAEPGESYRYQVKVFQSPKNQGADRLNIAGSNAVLKVYRYGSRQPDVFKVDKVKAKTHEVWFPCMVVIGNDGSINVQRFSRSNYLDKLLKED